MIYTVTFNPALDYITKAKKFRSGATNRIVSEVINPGGKGINVSLALRNLGIESRAILFIAGFTGDELVRKLGAEKIQTEIIRLNSGMTRINVKIRSFEGSNETEFSTQKASKGLLLLSQTMVETELNGMGPEITDAAMEEFYQKIGNLKEGDILVLSGSIPSGMPKNVYAEILKRVDEKNQTIPASKQVIKVVVDATGELLTHTLPHHPFLIKPNKQELEDLFGVRMERKEDIISYAKELQKMGAVNVLVSLAADGAVFLSEDGEVFVLEAPKGQVKNSVGAGDSMVAGFLAGFLTDYEDTKNLTSSERYQKAFQMGVCAGSASAFSEGMATREKVEELLPKIKNR